ncbi:hypothetical protein CTAYLR_009533 [Chrysophaeum taylorii]|uniref:CCHC-type domain-containing protein n=1 Tax=Chrysophaeum taylorii TaxID=2483200 RepID=A0AAD7UIP3_9STRA|nr:hypothetical protein CTAYLR_009533 [Chrysophaeum taylorii]
MKRQLEEGSGRRIVQLTKRGSWEARREEEEDDVRWRRKRHRGDDNYRKSASPLVAVDDGNAQTKMSALAIRQEELARRAKARRRWIIAGAAHTSRLHADAGTGPAPLFGRAHRENIGDDSSIEEVRRRSYDSENDEVSRHRAADAKALFAAIEDFIEGYDVDANAASRLRGLSKPAMRAVLAEGPLDGRNVSAVLVSRINRLPPTDKLERNYGTPPISPRRGYRRSPDEPAARTGAKNVLPKPDTRRSLSSYSSSGSSDSHGDDNDDRDDSPREDVGDDKTDSRKGSSKWDAAPRPLDDPGILFAGQNHPDAALAPSLLGAAAPFGLGSAAAAALAEQQRKKSVAPSGGGGEKSSDGAAAPETIESYQSSTAKILARQQRHNELYIGNLLPDTTFETLEAFLTGILAALASALPGDATKAALVDSAPIVSGRACSPIGESRGRTDHAFIECSNADVASTLCLLNGIPAVGIAAGTKAMLRISRPKGFVPPPRGDRSAITIPVEVLQALGIDPATGVPSFDAALSAAQQHSELLASAQLGVADRVKQPAGGVPPSSYVCHRCGIGGHFVQDCPSLALGLPSLGLPPKGYVCRRCGVSGHFVQDCPQKLLENAAKLASTFVGPGGASPRVDAETLAVVAAAQHQQAEAAMQQALKLAHHQSSDLTAKHDVRAAQKEAVGCRASAKQSSRGSRFKGAGRRGLLER